MKKRNFVTAVILFALAIATLWEIRKLEIGGLSSPQTGLFPLILAILLAILSLTLLGQAMKGKDEEKTPSWVSSRGWRAVGLTLGVLFFFAIFFERLGYLISTFLLIFLLVGGLGTKKWWVGILFAFLSTLVSYLVFGMLLKAQLPAGILGS